MPKSKSKILFVLPTEDLTAGGEISGLELIRSCLSKGYQVHAFVRSRGQLEESLRELGVVTNVQPYNWWNHGVDQDPGATDILASVAIAEYLLDNKIDVTVTNTLNVPWGALGSSLSRTPHVWIAREDLNAEGFEYLRDRCQFIDEYSSVVMANSSELCRALKSSGVNNCKPFMSFARKPDSIGLENGEVRLISIGKIEPRKNQMELIRALSILKKKGIYVKALLIGGFDKEYKDLLEREISALSLGEQVEFSGFQDNPWRLVSPNDIYIQASLSESIGRSITEAMKLGLICVSADIPATKEAFGLGGGITYRSGSPRDLAVKLERVLTNLKPAKGKALVYATKAQKNMSESRSHQNFFKEMQRAIKKGSSSVDNSPMLKYFKSFGRELRDNANQNEVMKKDIVSLQQDLAEKSAHILDLEKKSIKGRLRIFGKSD